MKRAVLALALIGLLGIGGVVAWRRLSGDGASPGEAATAPAPVGKESVAPPAATANAWPPGEIPVPPQRAEEIVGVGAILKAQPDTGAVMITGAVPNSPAAAAGLAGEFLIRSIDDVSTEGMTLRECVERIRGVAGSKVRLELFNVEANKPMTVELTRQRIELQPQPPQSRTRIDENR